MRYTRFRDTVPIQLKRPTAGFRKRWIRAKDGIGQNLTAHRATSESIRVVYFCDDVRFALRTVLRDHLFFLKIRAELGTKHNSLLLCCVILSISQSLFCFVELVLR